MPSLHLSDIEVRFPGLDTPALKVPHLQIGEGEMVAVIGPSGSGKSTLINVLAGLELARRGRILWGAIDLASLSESARDRWRGANIGLVMQDFHLFPGLSVLDNILLPARLARLVDTALRARAEDLLESVRLCRPDQLVETMSRGEMQRVAVARAVLRRPGVIIADEPTASLDAVNGASISQLLIDLARETGATLIAVTHDPALMDLLPRRISLRDGEIIMDNARSEAA